MLANTLWRVSASNSTHDMFPNVVINPLAVNVDVLIVVAVKSVVEAMVVTPPTVVNEMKVPATRLLEMSPVKVEQLIVLVFSVSLMISPDDSNARTMT